MPLYAHCNNGCGNRTPLTPSQPAAVCPNCGEPGIVILASATTARSTEGYDASGNPVAGKGTPFNRPQTRLPGNGAFIPTKQPTKRYP